MRISKFETLAQLKDAVTEKENVVTVSSKVLLDAFLKEDQHLSIPDALASLGLGVQYQDDLLHVRVYRLGSSIARLLEAVEKLTPQNDDYIRNMAHPEKAIGVIDSIRKIVNTSTKN